MRRKEIISLFLLFLLPLCLFCLLLSLCLLLVLVLLLLLLLLYLLLLLLLLLYLLLLLLQLLFVQPHARRLLFDAMLIGRALSLIGARACQLGLRGVVTRAQLR